MVRTTCRELKVPENQQQQDTVYGMSVRLCVYVCPCTCEPGGLCVWVSVSFQVYHVPLHPLVEKALYVE